MLPATSVDCGTTRLTPGLSEMLQEKPPLETVIAAPLQVVEASPERESETVPEMVTEEEVDDEPSAGEERTRGGGVLSILRVVVTEPVLPPASVTMAVYLWLAPSVEMV